uniref:Gamma-glutamyltranspeptidase 1 n=1 Tax=Cacopsylla melanoneura TaxID=428564 RepID=A0A8D9ARM6_9HEMI
MPEKQHQGRSYHLNRAPSKRSKLRPILLAALFIALILITITILFILLTGDTPTLVPHYREQDPPDVTEPLAPSPARLRTFQNGAVCADTGPVCGQIARDILAIKGASIIDSTVAALLCGAVYAPHTSGLGGGFVLTYYRRAERTTFVLNARESAPLNATADMCREKPSECQRGANSSGTPGTLLGLHTVWQRWGKLPWETLVQPSIQLCTNGFNMTSQLSYAAQFSSEEIAQDEYLRETFLQADNMTAKPAGSWIKPSSKLCDTLRIIGTKGVFDFYEGVLGDDFALDVKQMQGVLSREDLRKYKVEWSDVSVTQLNTGHTLYVPPAPHSGDLLIFTMNILNGFAPQLSNSLDLSNKDQVDNSTLLNLHRMLEAFKYAESKRELLGDPRVDAMTQQLLSNLRSRSFADVTRANISDTSVASDYSEGQGHLFGEDHVTRPEQDGAGYSHFSLISPDGDAVSVTSSLGSYFGAKVSSRRTGLILNSALGDFSLPPPPSDTPPKVPNLPGPAKRPASPSSPAIVVNRAGDVQLVLGGWGGDRVTGAMTQFITKYLRLKESDSSAQQDLKTIMDSSRIFARQNPSQVFYEYGFIKKYIEELYRFGHTTSRLDIKASTSGLCAVGRSRAGTIEAVADWRTGGEVAGL